MGGPSVRRLRELLDYDPATGVFTWRLYRGRVAAGSVAGSLDRYGYRQIQIDGKLHLAHRLAWLYVYGEWPSGELDHADGSRDSNGINNLRPATRSQNNANAARRRDNKSGFKGVHFHGPRQRFIARVQNRHLGYFDAAEEAAAAYKAEANATFGEFAKTGT